MTITITTMTPMTPMMHVTRIDSLCNLQNFTEELKKEKDSQPLKVVCLNAENSLYLTS